MRSMRKRYRILMFAALVAALAVPVGYAVSLESTPAAPVHTYARDHGLGPVAVAAALAPITRRGDDRSRADPDHPVPDAAKLLGVGTILFGLAAALRRAPQAEISKALLAQPPPPFLPPALPRPKLPLP